MVHLFQFLLGCLEGVWGRVELVGFEALIRELDCERLVIFLWFIKTQLATFKVLAKSKTREVSPYGWDIFSMR